ncbi:MAG: transcription elongation factor GreA [Gammaproteobacteria bacterium]|nr:MAG: transcription elongation factor GreA [Gammaproteobacteria bacterium]
MEREPMTAQSAEALSDELTELKTVVRPRITNSIADARAHGDLKENAEYHAAREQQSFSEGRIAELESKMSNAQIIDVTSMTNNGKVIFGATVKLFNLDTDKEVTYRIVGHDEADIKKNLISFRSPIARALIGKDEGDETEVQTPGGLVAYEISKVDYI